MTYDAYWAVIAALAISSAAALIWLSLLVVVVGSLARKVEGRVLIVVMPLVGLLASIGTLASAIGFGISSGVLDLAVSTQSLTLVASMGRGGLLMGGVIALGFYRPESRND